MVTADSVKNKILSLINVSNSTTGQDDTDLTSAVNHLKEGFGKPFQEKTIDITENGTMEVIPDENKALSKVTVNVNVPNTIPEGYIKPSGTLEITENNKEYDVSKYEKANVQISSQSKLLQIADGSVTEITADDLKGITKIKRYMFEDCLKLESITIPEGVTTIGYRMCYEDTSLKSITIPDSVTSLGSSSFYGCTSLETVRLSNKLSVIDYRMFYGCSKLKNITIPDSVTGIGSSAFYGCTSLKEVTILANHHPPILQDNQIFMNVPTTCIFRVHNVSLYESMTNWSNVVSKFEFVEIGE